MAENSMKPRIRFKGYTDAWEQRKLGECINFYSGLTYSPTDIVTRNGVLVLRSSNVQEGEIVDEDNVFVCVDAATSDNVVIGDIIVVVRNGSRSLIGKHAKIKKNMPQTVIGAFMTGLRYENSDYLNAVLNTSIFEREIEKDLGATINQITTGAFKKMVFPFPKQSEQLQIGLFFERIDNLITLHQRKYDKIVNIKKALLEKMFPADGETTPKIRFKGFTDAWEQRKLGEVGETYAGLTGKSKEDFGHGEGRFITYMNVFSNAIVDVEMVEPLEIDEKQNSVKKGDVFFTTSSETPEEVGMTSVLLENSKNTYLNSFCFGYRPSFSFDNYYLAYMLRSKSFRERIIFLAQGISRYNISKNKVMEIAVPTPELAEQQEIGTLFKQLDNLITLHQRQLEKLKNIKSALLEKMFI